MAIKNFAAIDVGSDEVCMKIFQISKKSGIKEIDYVRAIIELGSDTYASGKVSVELVEKLCAILSGFTRKMAEYRIEDYVAYASSAIREAANGEMIIDQIKLRTNLDVIAIDNTQQRFLILKSLVSTMANFDDVSKEGTAVLDLGAGSFQVSVFERGLLQLTQNLKLGSLRIRELLSGLTGKTLDFVALMDDYISNDIETLKQLTLKGYKVKNMIAVGQGVGTVLHYYSTAKNRDSLTIEQFEKLYNKLLRLSVEDISEKYSIPYETATVIKPSIMIYHHIATCLGVEVIWSPNGGLCDGIAAEYAEVNERIQVSHNFDNDILSVARNIARKFHSNVDHTKNVEELSLQLFDGIRKITGLTARDRILLSVAAILHDCGKFINMKEGSINSYQIVMSTEIIGLSGIEKEIIANVIRYNSSAEIPKYGQIQKVVLNRKSYIRMLKLMAIMSLANGMDRSHQQRINKVIVRLKEQELRITADTIYDITLEQGLIARRSKLFEEVFGIKPVLRQKRSV